MHGAATRVLSSLLVIIGVVMLVRTATLGGGSVGYLFGVLFVAAGAARLYLLSRDREGGR